MFEGHRRCRIHHFQSEEQVSTKSGQRDPESVRFLIDTSCVYSLVLGTCL